MDYFRKKTTPAAKSLKTFCGSKLPQHPPEVAEVDMEVIDFISESILRK
jgi:hypothetical protein